MHVQNAVREHLVAVGRRMLEGRHVWGSVDVSPLGHTTMARYRVTVFPPGTNAAERRLLHLHRTAPVTGSVVLLFLLCTLGEVLPPVPLLIAVVIGYAGSLVAISRLTRELRQHCRRVEAVIVAVNGGVETHGDPELVASTMGSFAELDASLQAGAIGNVEYERRWNALYFAVPLAA